jgi:hypothetical protein
MYSINNSYLSDILQKLSKILIVLLISFLKINTLDPNKKRVLLIGIVGFLKKMYESSGYINF